MNCYRKKKRTCRNLQHVLPGNLAQEGFNLTTYLPKKNTNKNDQGKGSFTVILLKGCVNEWNRETMVHFLVVDSATRTWNWSSYRRCLRQSPVVGQMVSPIHSRQAFSPTHPAYHCANGQDFHHLAHTILTTPDFKRPSFWCIVGISWKCHFRRAFMFHQQQDETQNSSSRVKCELFIMWFLTSSPSSPPKKGRFIFLPKDLWFKKNSIQKTETSFHPTHPPDRFSAIFYQGANPGIMCTWEVDALGSLPRSELRSPVLLQKSLATTGPFVWKCKLDHHSVEIDLIQIDNEKNM